MFYTRELSNIYTCVSNQKMHTDKIFIIMHNYPKIYFGCFYDQHLSVLQEYR
jgi:hypothetical protein